VLGTTGKINAQNFADKVDEVYAKGYDVGYEQGAADNMPSVDPNWTDWQYAFAGVSRSNLLEKLKYSDTSKGTNFHGMFKGNSEITAIPQFDTSNGTIFDEMFNECNKLVGIPNLSFEKHTGTLINLFRNCFALQEILIDLSKCKPTKTTAMFQWCKTLVNAPEVDTSQSSDFTYMFYNCNKLKNVPRFDCSKILSNSSATALTSTFDSCSQLEYVGIEGIIRQTIKFASSPLNIECAKNILIALADYSGTSYANKKTITFKSTVKDALIADGATAPDGKTWEEYVTAKGWTW
jgi:hypothetical protein